MPPLLQFARYREIAAEIASRLAARNGEEVIVASRGLAASATAELLRRSETTAVSVRLSMLDTFARRVVNDAGEYPHVATDAERRLAMRAALAGVDAPMMETRGIAAMMERSYRDVRDGGLGIDEFEKRAHSVTTLRNRRRTEMIVRSWRAYEQLIAALPAVDPADVLERAATLIESGRVTVSPQVVAGFYDMTGAQLRLLAALDTAGKLSAVFVPIGEGEAYAFPQSSVLHIKTPTTTVAQYDTKEMELRAVCGAIRELLDAGTAPTQIGIATRMLDPDDVRLLQRFSEEHGFAVSERTDISLAAHRLGRGVTAILRLRSRNFPRGDVIDILRDGFEPRKRVYIDRLDTATRRARISGGRSADLRNPSSDPTIEDYRSVVAELEAIGSASLFNHAASRFRLDTDLDLAAAASLDDIASLLQRWKQQVDAETVIDLIEQSALTRQPTTDNRQPIVWLGDVMKFRGRTFEHVFVIRAQESTFPQRRVDDPLLPDSDRRQLGIREIGDGRDEERLLFQLLFDGASSSIRFSLATSDTFGKILRPSRMLPSSGASRHLLPREKAVANSEPSPLGEGGPKGRVRGPNLQRQLQLVCRAGTRSTFDGYLGDDIRALITEKLQAVSPTQLEDFGECPQKFLFKHILGVTDYDDPDRELQMHHREKGKLDHTILERFYRSIDVLPPPDLRERIDAIVDAAFDEEETRVPAFNRVMRQIERRATKRNLRAFLADDISDLLGNGLEPKYFEYKFGPKHLKRGPVDHPEPFVIAAHDVPIRVEGSIDRIDQGATKLRIVDYKSGKALRHVNLSDKIDRGVRLQLALYAMAVSEFFGRPPETITGAIKPLVVRGTDSDKLKFDLGEAQTRLRETLDLFVASMLRGAFPAFPNDDDNEKNFNSCKYCPVNHSCRTRHAEAERRLVVRYKDPRTLLETLS